jgi:hypothetical protein
LRTTAAATLAVPLNVSIGQLGQIVGKLLTVVKVSRAR